MLTHLKPQEPKNGNSKNTVKRGSFWWYRVGRRQGRRPLSPSERRPTARTRPAPGPAGPWPDLSAYARQPARGPTMLAHLVAMLAYVGLRWPMLAYVGLCWPMLAYLAGNVGPAWGCWPSLGVCWPILKAMWADREAYVGRSWGLCWPMLTHVEPKDPKNGNSNKHCKTQDILMVGGLSRGYVGPSWGYVGLAWGQCGPILGLCWPILGLCWPSLRVMLPHFKAMLADLGAYVAPCWPILSH